MALITLNGFVGWCGLRLFLRIRIGYNLFDVNKMSEIAEQGEVDRFAWTNFLTVILVAPHHIQVIMKQLISWEDYIIWSKRIDQNIRLTKKGRNLAKSATLVISYLIHDFHAKVLNHMFGFYYTYKCCQIYL
jgi:hypothetical protein